MNPLEKIGKEIDKFKKACKNCPRHRRAELWWEERKNTEGEVMMIVPKVKIY